MSVLEQIGVSNIYIFISDALRWSATPDSIKSHGAAFRTVSAGCATMRSVSSMLTGLNPPRHGVVSWTDALTEPTIFDIPETNAGFYNPAAGSRGGLSAVLGQESENTLQEIQQPFVYVERDKGGHAPYGERTYEEMLTELDHTHKNLMSHYSSMVEKSIDRFEQRLQTLSDRGLLTETLVVFLGDHGELLGEHGLVSHSSPPTPELVYTPTVFSHPEIREGERSRTIGHVDLVPTVLDAISASTSNRDYDGVNLFKSTPGPRYNDAIYTRTVNGSELKLYHASGLWDGDGGHVFTNKGKLAGIVVPWLKANGWNREYLTTNPTKIPTALWHHIAPHREHGSPNFSKSDAIEGVSTIQAQDGTADSIEIDEEVEERLEELGYRL